MALSHTDALITEWGSQVVYGLLNLYTDRLPENQHKNIRKLLSELIPLTHMGSITVKNKNNDEYIIAFLPCYKNHNVCCQLQTLYNEFSQEDIKRINGHISVMIHGIQTYYAALMSANENIYKIFNESPLHVDRNNYTFFIHPDDDIRFGLYVQKPSKIPTGTINYSSRKAVIEEIAKLR